MRFRQKTYRTLSVCERLKGELVDCCGSSEYVLPEISSILRCKTIRGSTFYLIYVQKGQEGIFK